MNKFFNKWLIIIPAILLLCGSLNAQFGVRSIGLSGGYYSPSMDYWNDNALTGWGETFGGSIYGNANIEFNIVKILSVRIGVGYWSQTVSDGNIPFGTELRTDEISIQLLPVNFDMLIRTPDDFGGNFGFYGGIGAGMNFINMKYSVSIPSLGSSEEEHSGRDFVAHVILGLDYKVMESLAIGTEFRYAFGKYQQDATDGVTITGNHVSVDGPQIMATVKYLFLD